MNTLAAALAMAVGLGILLVAAWRAKRTHDALRPVRREDASVRELIATLKLAHKHGQVDEATYRERRRELAHRLSELTNAAHAIGTRHPPSWWLGAAGLAGTALGLALLMWPLFSSTPGGVSLQPAASATSAPHPLRADQVERTVAQMREQVKQNPKDATAWAMLAHSYDMLGRHGEASASYARLIELVPDDPQVLADAADSMALARGRQFQGEPMQLLQRALALDPRNLKALSLAGTEAFDRKDPNQAIAYWERARTQVTDAALARELDGRIAEARALQSRAVTAAAAPPAPAMPSAQAFVSGRVILSDKLKSRVSAEDVLFVFARPTDGSRMPVALMRRRASELPVEFKLDDSMALVPQSRLSGQASVIVGARVSRRGDAVPTAGDLAGFSAPVAVGTQRLQVEISEVVK